MKICILAGEKSGSNYGALLCKNLKKLKKDIFIFGTGGKEMEKEIDLLIKGMPLGIMGFSGVLKKIIHYWIFLKKVVKTIKEEKPDLIIFIDNPAFNLRVAKRLKKEFKKYYYIPPKIWAYNNYKVEILKKYIDVVIPIFPFEKEIYEKEKIPFLYFGHPVCDLVEKAVNSSNLVKKEEVVIGILPGSRKEEVKYNLPIIKKVLEVLHKRLSFSILISASEKKFEKIIKRIFRKTKIEYSISGDLYSIIKNSDLILAVSGTVNLEVAYFEKPMIVFYKTSILNYFIAKFMVKLNKISPVNIILDEKVVPEYIQNFKINDVIEDIINLLDNGFLYIKEINGFKRMKEILSERNVSENIARFIIEGVKS